MKDYSKSLVSFTYLLTNMIKLQDDPSLYDYNVEQRVNDFIDAALTQVKSLFDDLHSDFRQ